MKRFVLFAIGIVLWLLIAYLVDEVLRLLPYDVLYPTWGWVTGCVATLSFFEDHRERDAAKKLCSALKEIEQRMLLLHRKLEDRKKAGTDG